MGVDEEIYIDTVTSASLRLIYIFHFDLTPGGGKHEEYHCVTRGGREQSGKKMRVGGRGRAEDRVEDKEVKRWSKWESGGP